jgi:hypothetical protein
VSSNHANAKKKKKKFQNQKGFEAVEWKRPARRFEMSEIKVGSERAGHHGPGRGRGNKSNPSDGPTNNGMQSRDNSRPSITVTISNQNNTAVVDSPARVVQLSPSPASSIAPSPSTDPSASPAISLPSSAAKKKNNNRRRRGNRNKKTAGNQGGDGDEDKVADVGAKMDALSLETDQPNAGLAQC